MAGQMVFLHLTKQSTWKGGDSMKLCEAVMQAIRKRRDESMNNKLEVVGIDHSWSMMKVSIF
jgi:hypothetical protein